MNMMLTKGDHQRKRRPGLFWVKNLNALPTGVDSRLPPAVPSCDRERLTHPTPGGALVSLGVEMERQGGAWFSSTKDIRQEAWINSPEQAPENVWGIDFEWRSNCLILMKK